MGYDPVTERALSTTVMRRILVENAVKDSKSTGLKASRDAEADEAWKREGGEFFDNAGTC